MGWRKLDELRLGSGSELPPRKISSDVRNVAKDQTRAFLVKHLCLKISSLQNQLQRITLFLSGKVTLSNFLSGAESSGTSTMLNAQIVEAIRQRSYSLRPVEDSVVKRRIARKSQQRLQGVPKKMYF